MAEDMTTRETVVNMAPELATIPASDSRWTAFIEEAALNLPAGPWGKRRKLGSTYFVAHRMTLSLRAVSQGTRGAVQSESVGGVSRTYAAASSASGSSPWDATIYGTEYRRLVRIVGGGPR